LLGISSVYAQDIITLRNGDEIKARVTEITPSEIKYKRFENLDGPTVTVAKSDVFAINYENGTREVINSATSTAQAARTASQFSAASHGGSSFGIYLNTFGFVVPSPLIGAEITANNFIIDIGLGFRKLTLLHASLQNQDDGNNSDGGFLLSAGLRYFNARPNGGLYFGPTFGLMQTKWTAQETSNAFFSMGGIGYKFIRPSGLYFRIGAHVGTMLELGDLEPFGSIDLAIGFKF